jgi:glyoxylase-like metal-dependent hydrolase (beta-lactamase superfamily II)
MQVADGIHWVDGIRFSNVYVVETGDGLLLVDTGTPWRTKRICRFIETIGRHPGELRHIVLTHCDIDHVGSAAALKARTGAAVAMHEADAAVFTRAQRPRRRMVIVQAMYPLVVRPVTPDRLLEDGDTVGGLRVVHIPGHTDGSIALLRDDGVVFTGDALLSDKKGDLVPPHPKLAQDPAEARASADRILALRPRLVLTGHGAPATPDPGASFS